MEPPIGENIGQGLPRKHDMESGKWFRSRPLSPWNVSRSITKVTVTTETHLEVGKQLSQRTELQPNGQFRTSENPSETSSARLRDIIAREIRESSRTHPVSVLRVSELDDSEGNVSNVPVAFPELTMDSYRAYCFLSV